MAVDQERHQIVWNAISNRQLLRFEYKGDERIVEPHDYGIQNGTLRLLCWQIGGRSGSRIPGWRLMDLDGMQAVEMLDKQFAGNREVPSGKHQRWDKVFIRVEPNISEGS